MEEDYYFQIDEDCRDNHVFVLIIYDIVSNKRRVKFAKFLLGYGFRVQKSAFEATLPLGKYNKLIHEIPRYISLEEDSVRLYKIIGKGQVISWGEVEKQDMEDIILI